MPDKLENGGNNPPKKPGRNQLQERVHAIALETSEKVIFTNHAQDRMSERDILTRDVMRVLETGFVEGKIEPGEYPGEWSFKVVKGIRGRREAGVGTVLTPEGELVLTTVEWEDL